MKRAVIITTGDELLHGTTIDTNSSYISWHFFGTGITVVRHVTVGDEIDSIINAINEALSEDLIIITGGLGPTDDDNTVEAICRIFHRSIVPDAPSVEKMISFFESMKIKMNERDYKMAAVPERAFVLKNNKGLAPGFIIEENGKTVVALPGVPSEAQKMFDEGVIPYLKESYDYISGNRILIKVTGIRESDINTRINTLCLPGNIQWGVSAKYGVCDLCFMSRIPDFPDKQQITSIIKKEFSNFIIGEEFSSPEDELIHLLRKHSLTISTAESCTGGLIGKKLTDIAGASDVFSGTVTAYSNSIKTGILGVSENTILEHGAVSEETASEMARGIKKLFGTNIGVSVTGIAGPGGATKDKPVGTVCFGFCINENMVTKREFFSGDRERIRNFSALYAVNYIRKILLSL